MKYFSQNLEDQFIHRYFKQEKGTVLEIGANSGQYLSNSLALINLGWQAVLLEPGESFVELKRLHENNSNVHCFNFGIGSIDGLIAFYESGAHVKGGTDSGLVSSAFIEETIRWEKTGVNFKETEVQLLTFNSFLAHCNLKKFDFISIDAEGFDWVILQQIDLAAVGCKCLCIEWNGDFELYNKFVKYCQPFGLKLRLQNNENLIFVK